MHCLRPRRKLPFVEITRAVRSTKRDYMKAFRIFQTLAAILATAALGGCGGDTAPPPPTGRSKLVLAALDAMDAKNHELALRKIARLRTLAPSNVFLANLEIAETNNAILADAQKRIDDGSLQEALAVVDNGIREHGRHDTLMTARKKLAVAAKVEQLLKMFENPRDSDTLRAAAQRLLKIAKAYPPAKDFAPIAERQLAKAREMAKREMARAVDGLCSDIDTAWKNGDEDIDILYAVLEVERPDHPLLKEYISYLEGDEYASPEPYPEEDIFADDEEADSQDGEPMEDSMEGDSGEPAAPAKEEKKPEKKKSWWDRFSF